MLISPLLQHAYLTRKYGRDCCHSAERPDPQPGQPEHMSAGHILTALDSTTAVITTFRILFCIPHKDI
jgi:hypothetical protein